MFAWKHLKTHFPHLSINLLFTFNIEISCVLLLFRMCEEMILDVYLGKLLSSTYSGLCSGDSITVYMNYDGIHKPSLFALCWALSFWLTNWLNNAYFHLVQARLRARPRSAISCVWGISGLNNLWYQYCMAYHYTLYPCADNRCFQLVNFNLVYGFQAHY